MRLPSTVGHNDHEMPQNIVKYVAMKGRCWLEGGPCQLPLQRLNHDCHKMLTFNTPLKGVQGGDKKIRHSVLWKKTRKTGLQIVKCFQVKIFTNANSCIFSYLENTTVTNQCLDLVLLASPTTAFLLPLIFGPYVFHFLVKFVSPSSSTTRISPGQHPHSDGTSCLILWTLVSLYKCTPRSLGYSPPEIS